MITDPKPQIPQSRSSTPEPINSTLKIPMVTTSKHPLFYINRGGFPLNNENQQKMFNFCLDRTKDLNLEFHNQVLEISEKNLGQFKVPVANYALMRKFFGTHSHIYQNFALKTMVSSVF